MPPPVLAVSNIRKSFAGQPILRGISFEVPNTQVVAIIGPSGGGKSTLLRCVNLLETPDEGIVRLDGETLSRSNAARLAELRARMGMVFQLFNLFPHLTARQNVSLALKYALKLKNDEADERAVATLTRVGLAHKIDAYPRHLSGGQQQRVAIARALVMRPRLMVFDEPTSALDVEMVAEVLQVMRDLVAEGMTMVVVSHEMRFVRSAADRILFIEEGRIVEDRPARDFLDNPHEERSRRFVTAIA